MNFARRAHWDLTPNPLAQLRSRKEAAGAPILDLTPSNPTRVGLPDPDPDLLQALADSRSRIYEPDPLGLRSAREAIARHYAARGSVVDPDLIVLTASSSESYGFLFKLLCDAGDRVLVPTPSYPLFEFLAGLDLVETSPYRLDPARRWGIDGDSVRAARDERTRAVIVVHPNNPTGSFLRRREAEELVGWLKQRDLALVADEVFGDYADSQGDDRVLSFAGETRVPTFVLGGFSKSLGLPQLKLGWIVVAGPETECAEALRRLTLIADTYLSVSTPVQHACAPLLARLPALQNPIRERLRRNREIAARPGLPPVVLPDGGWSAWVELPPTRGDDEWALELLDRYDVFIHPGFFFGFEGDPKAVISLLTPPEVFGEGLRRIGAAIGSPRSA